MKIFTTILIIIAALLIIFNTTQIDFKNISNKNNSIAFIEIMASFCAILILLIYHKSKKIVDKTKNN
jgi:hypothetical protein